MTEAERLRELIGINRTIASTLDYDEVLRLVVHKTAEFTRADACALLLQGDDGLARPAAWVGIDDERAGEVAAPLDENIASALRSLLDYGPGDTFLGVPVIEHDTLAGILAAKVSDQPPPNGAEESLLSALADQAAIALSHAAQYRRAEQRVQEREAELRAALERHAAELEEANDAKDHFFNALSHELRTPLSTIENGVELLRRKEDGRERVLALIERSVDRLARLVDDILDLSRLMRGRLTLDREPLDAVTFVEELVEPWRARAEEAGVELVVEGRPETVTVEADRQRLGQILDNLLSNAVKFTPAGGRVTVSVRPDGGEAVISVADTGAGIDPDLIPHIFEPFRHGARGAPPAGAGLGLGLSIAHSIASEHGGRLIAASEGPGSGSAFTLRLPRLEDDLAASSSSRGEARSSSEEEGGAPAESVSEPPAGARGQARATPRRVLLVEDHEDLRASMVELIARRGHHVFESSEGREALELAARARPDVILIDIGLAGMSGYELARRIRRDPELAAARLVALTGYASDGARERARESGFDLHVAKPADASTLESLLAV